MIRAATARDANAKPSKRAWGDAVERAVEFFLVRHGLKSVSRQAHTRFGEVDLILLHHDALVFVEVRYRATQHYGGGLQSVTASKQARLIKAAQIYLAAHPQFSNHACRFDVVAASGPLNALQFDWVQNAFQVE